MRHIPDVVLQGPAGSHYAQPRRLGGFLGPPGVVQLRQARLPVGHLRPAERARSRAVPGAGQAVRRVPGEQRRERGGEPGHRLGRAARGQPAADHGPLPRLRHHRALRPPQGLRHQHGGASPGTRWSAATPATTRPPRPTRCTATRTRARTWPGRCRPRCWPGSGPARGSWWSCRSPRRCCTTSPTTCWTTSSTAVSGASAATTIRRSRPTACSRARGRTGGSPSPVPPTRRSPRCWGTWTRPSSPTMSGSPPPSPGCGTAPRSTTWSPSGPATTPPTELARQLQASGVAAAALAHQQEMHTDEHLAARNFFTPDHPPGGRHPPVSGAAGQAAAHRGWPAVPARADTGPAQRVRVQGDHRPVRPGVPEAGRRPGHRHRLPRDRARVTRGTRTPRRAAPSRCGGAGRTRWPPPGRVSRSWRRSG